MKTATIVKHTGSHYLLAELPEWNLFPAVLRGKIRLGGSSATNPVAVGDRVPFVFDGEADEVPSPEHPAVITSVLPRKNYMIRKSANLSRQAHIIAANLDRAFIIVTMDFPEVKLPFLDRLLVTCEVYGIPAVVVVHKTDLFGGGALAGLEAVHFLFENAGYEGVDVSAFAGKGGDRIRGMCGGRGSLFFGGWGVGEACSLRQWTRRFHPGQGRFPEPICRAGIPRRSMRCTGWPRADS